MKFNRLVFPALMALLLAAVVLVGGGGQPVAAALCTTTLNPGDDIQSAINGATAGDVICLNAGLYSPPAKININKSVTLQGPQAGVDPRPGAGSARVPGDTSTESVISGLASGLSGIIVITANNVVLDGLDVTGGKEDLIDSETSPATTGTIIRYTILHDSAAPGDDAIQLRECTDCVVEYNYAVRILQDGINLCCGSTGGVIQFNELHDNSSENAAIYVYDAENVSITCNAVYDVHFNDGIKLGDKGGDDVGLSGGVIAYNVVHDTTQDGISVYMSDTTVEGNAVYNSTSENGAIYVAHAVSDIVIRMNDVHDNVLATGKWGDPGGIMIGTGVFAGTVEVSHNNLVGNSVNGVTNKAVAALNAENNWWGAADGPSGAGLGSGDGASSNVDFDPWLTEAQAIPDGCMTDDEGPITSDVAANPNPAAVNSATTFTAVVDDTTTGNSNIASATYNIYDAANLLVATGPMAPEAPDTFDSPVEAVTADYPVTLEAGVYDLCVFGVDQPGNVGEESCILFVVYDPNGGFVTGGGWINTSLGERGPIYDTIPDILPGSYPSLGYEATSTDESGDHIMFAGAERLLDNVVITLTNWSCVNDFDLVGGVWTPNRDGYAGEACVTTPGSGFDHPITLNIYAVDYGSGEPQPGALLASKTETFFIPFRPSWDDVNCTADGQTPATYKPFGGKWYDPVLGTCVTGFNSLHTYDFSGDGLVLPDEIIYGVAYNTAHHGAAPIGTPGPYSSLNLGLTPNPALVGINLEADDLYWDTSHSPFYCDGGAGGTDTFRRDYDAGCWTGYTPVAEFNVDSLVSGKANFGFVSKYKQGRSVPDGSAEFVFQAAGLNFHSNAQEWLVVTGSDYARFKGSGTINGANAPNGDPYKFMIWAGDDAPDTFRIKIWWEDVNATEIVVFDNGMDQPIDGGNIVIHN